MTYVVEQISTKKVNTKFGEKDAYSIKANGEWYSFGFKKPVFKVGDSLDFQYTDGSYGKSVDVATVRLAASAPAGGTVTSSAMTPPAAGRAYSGPPAKVFPVPATHGDRSIIRQNALTNAREVFVAAHGSVLPWEPDAIAKSIIALAKNFEMYTAGDLDEFVKETGTSPFEE